MNKITAFAILILLGTLLFSHWDLQKTRDLARIYKVERDSLLIANRCPQPLRTRIYTGSCLNREAKRHDFDLHVSNLKTAAGDTVGFMPLCESCFEGLSPAERVPFYEKLIGIYEQRNRQDIFAQVKNGF